MTLNEKLLPKLSDWRPVGDGRHSLNAAFPDEGWSVQLAADKADTLSCLLWEVSLARTSEVPAQFSLRDWAARVASRVTGLMEPLRVLEVDDARGEAVLRSDTPAKKGERVAYYEVRLANGTTATVRRFHASRTASGREQVAFAITHEALAKLASDIAQ